MQDCAALGFAELSTNLQEHVVSLDAGARI